MIRLKLYPTEYPHVLTDRSSREPLFALYMVDGVQCYLHQSGYGYLGPDRVEIMPESPE